MASTQPNRTLTTAIVGGGICGLALAHALKERGKPFLLFESSPRFGGTIQTREHQGILTETGPNGFLPTEPAMTRLIDSLQLRPKVRAAEPSAKKRFIYTGGRLRALPTSPPAFLTSDLLPLGSRLRVIGEVMVGRGKPDEDESLAAFAKRRFGRRASRVIADAVQSGIFAGNPAALSVRSAFPKLHELERNHRSLILGLIRAEKTRRKNPAGASSAGAAMGLCSFEGGLETLVSALGRSAGPYAHTGAKVVSLARSEQGWTFLVSEKSQQAVFSADRVVLAVPAFVASGLVKPLDAALAANLEALPYAPVAVVHLVYRRADLAGGPEGFGFLVPSGEGRRLLGAMFVSSFFPWRSSKDHFLITCMIGGAQQPKLAELDDEALLQIAAEELKAISSIDAAPVFTEVIRWHRAIPQYNVGHSARLQRIDDSLAKIPGLYLTGNAYRGISMNDCVRTAAELAARLDA
jgi:oxygen-dependent protoporphyrinogen oxidase